MLLWITSLEGYKIEKYMYNIHSSRMAFERLPVELTEIIILSVYDIDSDQKEYCLNMLVCRQWHQILNTKLVCDLRLYSQLHSRLRYRAFAMNMLRLQSRIADAEKKLREIIISPAYNCRIKSRRIKIFPEDRQEGFLEVKYWLKPFNETNWLHIKYDKDYRVYFASLQNNERTLYDINVVINDNMLGEDEVIFNSEQCFDQIQNIKKDVAIRVLHIIITCIINYDK